MIKYKRKFYLLVILIMISVMFGSWYCDKYIYMNVHLDVDETLQDGGVLRVKGDAVGESIANYDGKYIEYVDFYLKFLENIDMGISTIDMVTEASVNKLDSFIEVAKIGKERWTYTNLIAVVEYDKKIIGFLERGLSGSSYKALSFFTVVESNKRKRIDFTNELNVVEKEMLNSGYYAKDTQSEIYFLNLWEKLYVEFIPYFCGDRLRFDDGLLLLTKYCSDYDNEVVNLFLDSDLALNQLFDRKKFSPMSEKVLVKWLSDSEYKPSEVNLGQVFGRNVTFHKKISLSEDCSLYKFSKSEVLFDVFVCSGKITNVFYESGYNQAYKLL